MAAESGGAAVLDRRHDLQLGEAQMPCLGETIAGPCGPEDIGDLQRGGSHDASAVALRLLADQARDLVERTGDGPHRTRRHLGIQRGVVELGMAQQDLDDADVDAILQQMGREPPGCGPGGYAG
jgi:hypothetical protein